MDSMVRFRCTEEEHARWFGAAEIAGVKFSTWARQALDVASDPDSGADCNIPVRDLQQAKPAVTTPSSAKPTTGKGGLDIPAGVCDRTGYDYLVCLCPVCKARRGG